MLKYFSLISIICVFSTSSVAQLTQNIRGKVLDKDSRYPLIGVMVLVKYDSFKLGAISDENGLFVLKDIPIGRIDIVAASIGYENFSINQVMLKSAKELVLEINLEEKIFTNETAEIVAKKRKDKPLNEMVTLSARTFTVEETSRYAAAAFDPARMAQNYAGVSSGGDDLFNEIVVRGNSPRGVLWRLEGIEIGNPNHFSEGGGQGGAISMLSSSTLSNSDFYTGAFSAEYGNALSGIFDLKLRKGNNKKRENSFMFGILGLELATEGPFNKNYEGSYLINYRYSTLGILDKTGLSPVSDVIPAYQDLSYNFSFPTKKIGTFNFFGVMGQNSSEIYDNFNNTDTTEETRDNYDGYKELEFKNSTGLKHFYNINNKTYIKTVISHTHTIYTGIDESLEIDTTSNSVFRFKEDNVKNTDNQFRISSLLNYKHNTKNSIRMGFITTYLNYDYTAIFNEYSPNEKDTIFNDKNNSMQYQAYVQWKHKFNRKITLNSGFHFNKLMATNSYSIEPRIGLQYKISRKARISIAVGKHSKPENLAIYLLKTKNTGATTKPNKTLPLTKAWHFVGAFDYRINSNLRFKSEAYYQHLFDIPISSKKKSTFSMVNASSFWDAVFRTDTTYFISNGTGRNIGIDLTLERFFNDNIYFLITTTLFSSTYKTQTGEIYNTRYNSQYQINVLGGKEFKLKKKNRRIGVNAKINTNGGNRYTPILIKESINEGQSVRDKTRPFSKQMKPYYRMDIGFSYKFDRLKSTHSLLLDVQNVSGRQNSGGIYFDQENGEIKNWDMTGFLPFFNYRIEF